MRSCASKFISRTAPAAALGLLLVPFAMSAVAAAENVSSAQANTAADAVIEVREGAAHPATCPQPDHSCDQDADLARERAYLVDTAHPGGTMLRQGPDVAIGRLHPEFAARLAGAIREARESGLPEAGIFSAYRPPAFGVGGFSDKFNSLHAYGLAVDMYGIGAPGSSEAKLWTKIAAKYGVVCPYGVNNRAEWNHCQPTRIKVIRAGNPLRATIAAQGPINPPSMFEAGKALIESVANLFTAFTGGGPAMAGNDGRYAARPPQQTRRIRTADARSAKHHRNVRSAGRKTKSVHVASRGRGHKATHATRAHSRRGQRMASAHD